MRISEKDSAANGFKKWSLTCFTAKNDNDEPGGATPIALAVPLRQVDTSYNRQSQAARSLAARQF